MRCHNLVPSLSCGEPGTSQLRICQIFSGKSRNLYSFSKLQFPNPCNVIDDDVMPKSCRSFSQYRGEEAPGRELTLFCGFNQYTLLQNRENSGLLGTPLYCSPKLGGGRPPPLPPLWSPPLPEYYYL